MPLFIHINENGDVRVTTEEPSEKLLKAIELDQVNSTLLRIRTDCPIGDKTQADIYDPSMGWMAADEYDLDEDLHGLGDEEENEEENDEDET